MLCWGRGGRTEQNTWQGRGGDPCKVALVTPDLQNFIISSPDCFIIRSQLSLISLSHPPSISLFLSLSPPPQPGRGKTVDALSLIISQLSWQTFIDRPQLHQSRSPPLPLRPWTPQPPSPPPPPPLHLRLHACQAVKTGRKALMCNIITPRAQCTLMTSSLFTSPLPHLHHNPIFTRATPHLCNPRPPSTHTSTHTHTHTYRHTTPCVNDVGTTNRGRAYQEASHAIDDWLISGSLSVGPGLKHRLVLVLVPVLVPADWCRRRSGSSHQEAVRCGALRCVWEKLL